MGCEGNPTHKPTQRNVSKGLVHYGPEPVDLTALMHLWYGSHYLWNRNGLTMPQHEYLAPLPLKTAAGTAIAFYQ